MALYELVLILGLANGDILEAVEGRYTDFNVCNSVGTTQVVETKKVNFNGFYSRVSYKCRNVGTIGKSHKTKKRS